jgi:hypothetical protein
MLFGVGGFHLFIALLVPFYSNGSYHFEIASAFVLSGFPGYKL